MKVQELVERLYGVNPDADFVFSKIVVLDKENELLAVMDVPVVGIAVSPDNDEVRFCIQAKDQEDVKHLFGNVVIEFFEGEAS